MKHLLKTRLIAMIAILAITIISCSDDTNDTSTADNTITGIASKTADFSILVQALNKAELTATLQGTTEYTVFAPTNAAFTAFLATTTYKSIDEVPKDVLTQILLNHVLTGTKKSTDLTTGYVKTLAKGSASTTNTLSMFVNTADNKVKLNGVATVTTANVIATNGVIHVVDKVIGLPTILTHAEANPNFSTLATIVKSTPQAAVATALTTNTSPLTVFAPTNTAFTAALGVGGFANGATDAQVTKVLQYHVTAAGNVLAATLTNGQVVPMITNPVQNITIDLTSGAKITDKSSTKANIVVTDVQCTNGVIHAIDKVLQPTL
ncbi:fasciclin domain-containing protein [Flavobacterium sp. UMI-01]|uniref:fasciclin domain-containing protein n=1 Tax=Flavobacterium sp. UMI-01 TaxID=1441053 RepID=UPI001C7D0249|nr:fasciclin domain-containing protein [Flavobacterium sp. UMI-01]GIZ09905.1 beta-Ig-H3/fasciclin domain-containing protein [Flavobacterium sp. UMI-01]